MTIAAEKERFIEDVQFNCDVSDAKDHGIYSMCSMILKLRNLYKWEYQIEPWSEPEPGDLLDWVDEKERYWEGLCKESFRPLTILGKEILPHNLGFVNRALKSENLLYGAGHGRSMKAVFFLAEILEKKQMEGKTVYILGNEKAKEMASPFAFVQDGVIIIKRESLRYFLWDQFQEMRSSCKTSSQYVLNHYELMNNGHLDHHALKERLNDIVAEELNLFIYHEIGETQDSGLDYAVFQEIIRRFPSSVLEFVCRSLKDVLADTHPKGLLSYIIRERKSSSLALYVSFLDGLREKLFPEIKTNWELFRQNEDWSLIENAQEQGRKRFLETAQEIVSITTAARTLSNEQTLQNFQNKILQPLGFDVGESQDG